MVDVRVAWLPEADRSLPLPTYQTDGAAGADLTANFPPSRRDGIVLDPGERTLVPTGLTVAVPDGYEMQIRPRSGLALKHGLSIPNAPGTVDSDYRGALGVILVNLGSDPVRIRHGDRIAQAVVAPVSRARFTLAGGLGETGRGAAGFGSTGNR